MAKASLIPRHVNLNMEPHEAFDLVMSLRALIREFDNVPDSTPGLLETLEEACGGLDLPPSASADADDGEAVTA